MLIRDMYPGDVERVAGIASSAMPHPWSRQVFHDCLLAQYNAWTGCIDDVTGSEIIGFAIAASQVDECQLLNLCIAPQLQGQGYGRQLFDHVIERIQSQGVEHMMLEVRKSNQNAITFYHTYGFREIGERKYYYPSGNGREDAVIMVRGF